MIVCELGIKDLITNSILGEVASNPNTNGMQIGQVYPANESRVEALDTIGLKYGANMYLVQPGGGEIIFNISIPEEVLDSYSSDKQAKTPWQTVNRSSKSDESLDTLAASLRAVIADNTAKLNAFVDATLLSAKRISQASKYDPDLFDAMSEVWTAIKSNPDTGAKLRMMSQFLSEAKAVMAVKLDSARFYAPIALSGNTDIPTDEAIVRILGIEDDVQLYKSLLDEYHRFMSDAPDNPIKSVVDAAYTDMTQILGIASKVHEANAVKELSKVLNPKFEKAKAELDLEVARLEANLAGASPKRRIALERRISKLRSDFERLAPSLANITGGITNQTGTSNLAGLNNFVLAGMMNPDIVVQGFMRRIKDAYQAAQNAFRKVGDDIEAKYQELLSTGFSDSNIDEAFRPLYQDVTEYTYNEDTDTIEELRQAYFTSEVDQNWRQEFTRLKAELAQASRKVLVYRQNTAEVDPTVLHSLEADYEVKKTAYIQWRRENFEPEYNEVYQATDAILDTIIGGVSLRTIRSSYYDQIGQIQNTVSALTGVPTQEEVDEINRLRREFEAIKSLEGKVPGTDAYTIAELFTRYQNEMKAMTERWDISPSALDRFHLRKADIDRKYEAGEIDKEARDRWYVTNTTIVYDPKYWATRRAYVDKLNSLAEEIQRITGTKTETNLKESYERMETISRKYRDHNSHIDGRKLTPEERAATLDLENQIEEVKRATKAAYSGFLGEEFADFYQQAEDERANLLEEKENIKRNDPSNSKITMDKISAINRRLKDLRGQEKQYVSKYLKERGVPEGDIKAFNVLYDQYRAAVKGLSDLTESVETEAYYEERQRQLNIFVAGKTQAERDLKISKTKVIRVGKTTYRKDDNGDFREQMFDGELSEVITPAEALLDHLYRKEFETSDWFLQNHYATEKYDRTSGEYAIEMRPIYSWRISKPSNPKYIKEAAPNIAWKRRVIAEEFRNPRYNPNTETPAIRAGRHENTTYQSARNANPALWEFRDYMVKTYLDAQEHYEEKDRIGLRVPSIEKNLSIFDTAQSIVSGKTPTAARQVGRRFKLNQQDQDEGLTVYSDEAGFERKMIPIRFSGRIDAELVSRNIVETVGKYAAQAQMYQARKEIAMLGKSLDTTLSFQNHGPSSETLDKTAKFMGIKKQNKSRGSNHRLTAVRNMVDMFVYGVTASEQTNAGRKVHKVISNLLGLRAATIFSEFPSIFAKVIGEDAVIGSTFWPQLINWFGGSTQQIIKSAIQSGTARFSLTDWAWAKTNYYRNSATFLNDVGKVSGRSYWTQFGEFFDVREQEYIDNFGEKVYAKGLLRNLNTDNLSFFKNVVEHELMMTTVMAFAKGYHIDAPTLPGGKVALSDAFEIVEGQLKLKDGITLTDTQLAEIRGNIATLLRDINGNYGKLDRVYAENYWVFKTAFFMRKWLIPQFVARYGGKRFSVEQDKIVQGYLRETGGLAWDAIRSGNAKGMAALLWSDFNPDLSADQRDALRKTRTELLLIATMYSTYAIALGYDDDDPERFQKLKEKSYFQQGLTYATVKATSEISTFTPPWGFNESKKIVTNLTSNVMPLVGDAYEILRKDIQYDLDPTTPILVRYKQKSGIHNKGDIKATAHLLKLLGRSDSKVSPVEALRVHEVNVNK